MPGGPGSKFFAEVQKEFHHHKTTKKHEAFKFFLNGMKDLTGAKSGQEIGIQVGQKVLTQLAEAGSNAIPVPGIGIVVGFAAGKIIDKAADEFLKWLEGEGAKFDKIEYEFERSMGEAFDKVIHHAGMLETSYEDYAKAYEELKKIVGANPVKKPPDPKALYKGLKALTFQFHSMLWVWNKLHRDAVAIIAAAEKLKTFATESAEKIKKEQRDLVVLLDELLKDNPGLALLGKK